MKLLRIWLLVLLAVLLPVRGALAATMLCAPIAATAAVDAHADCHEPAGATQADEADAADRCPLCSASCSATPLLLAVPGVAEPHGLTSVGYPDVAADAPSFVSDGQDRPPRTR